MFGTLVLASVFSLVLCSGSYQPASRDKYAEYEALLTGLQADGNLLAGYDCHTESIETQVVAGLNIRYHKKCADGQTCTITVWQKTWENFLKVTQNDCTQTKRQIPGGYNLVTDQVQVDEYMALLNQLQSSNQLDLTGYTIQHIYSQVVNGLNIRYDFSNGGPTCHVLVYSQVWTNTLELKQNTCHGQKRQLGGLVGGYNHVGVGSAEFKQYESVLSDLRTGGQLTVPDYVVTSIEVQVVAGLNIRYTLRTPSGLCHIVVYQDLQQNLHITSNDCPSQAGKRQLLGGYQHIDASDPEVQKCLSMSLDRINGMSNSLFRLVEDNVKAERQVVAGMNYALTFKTVPSTCMNSGDMYGKTSADCPVDTNSIMTHNKWSAHCFRDLSSNMSVTDVQMHSEEEPEVTNDSDNVKITGVKSGQDLVMPLDNSVSQVKLGKPRRKLLGAEQPVLTVVRRKRDLNFLIERLNEADIKKRLNDVVDEGKKLLGGGDDHDLVNHVKDLVGKDGHDLANHVQKMLGGDDHDLVDHVGKLLGQDGHDFIKHGQDLLGQDGHDLIKHGEKLLGGDNHDYKDHSKNMIGGDDHDYKDHGKNLIGGDDHDYKDHGKNMIGGDDHDYCHIGMFKDFKAKFNKMYGSPEEEEKRFMVFCDNMRIARKLQETEKGSAVYGATKFADLTKEEFRQYVGKPWDLSANDGMKKASIPRGKAPESFDWREHGAVTPVKNQGSCGSCWAFSTTGNIEGQWAIKKKRLISLSEQELVDCDKLDEGCNGGLPSNAYKEIERLGGLETEQDYAYKGEDEKCVFNKAEVKVYINDSVSVSSNEDEMASWLAENGPISIGINAFAMQFYMGGISHPWKIFCNPKSLDHGVLIVGYGVKDSEPYWIVKNSWGPDWGEKGYYLVYRGGGVCGLNTMCTSSVVD